MTGGDAPEDIRTVQDLIDRSNLSFRAFCKHLEGKEELVLALYENVTHQFTEDIRQDVAAADGPLGQLEAFCLRSKRHYE
jgi:AcrR family transcriptional regulator